MQQQLGLSAAHREIEVSGELHALREQRAAYAEHFRVEVGLLSVDNGHFWNETIATSDS